mmetsp:Transcript_43647/g.120725  ORF Transcript_43647/g.120725 Transcript_43647/m.120725 type:complete len:411 (+) Transcript_43647:647-1879(+)
MALPADREACGVVAAVAPPVARTLAGIEERTIVRALEGRQVECRAHRRDAAQPQCVGGGEGVVVEGVGWLVDERLELRDERAECEADLAQLGARDRRRVVAAQAVLELELTADRRQHVALVTRREVSERHADLAAAVEGDASGRTCILRLDVSCRARIRWVGAVEAEQRAESAGDQHAPPWKVARRGGGEREECGRGVPCVGGPQAELHEPAGTDRAGRELRQRSKEASRLAPQPVIATARGRRVQRIEPAAAPRHVEPRDRVRLRVAPRKDGRVEGRRAQHDVVRHARRGAVRACHDGARPLNHLHGGAGQWIDSGEEANDRPLLLRPLPCRVREARRDVALQLCGEARLQLSHERLELGPRVELVLLAPEQLHTAAHPAQLVDFHLLVARVHRDDRVHDRAVRARLRH